MSEGFGDDFADEFRDFVDTATDDEVLEAVYVIAHQKEGGEIMLTTGGVKPVTPGTRRELLNEAMERIK